MLGLSPEAPVEFVLSLEPAPLLDAPALAANHPRLGRLSEEYEEAEETLRLEVARQYPDLTLGPLLESDEGRSKVGLLGGLPIPLWNANQKRIAEARVERELARAAFETEYERLAGRLAALTTWTQALREQREDLENVLVPLVQKQFADAMELMRLGEGTSQVLESLTRSHQTKLELIEARTAAAEAWAELEYLTGAPLPALAPQATEESR